MSGGHHAQMQAYSQYSSSNGNNGYSSAQQTAAAYMSRGGDPNGYNGSMAYSSNYAPRGPAMGKLMKRWSCFTVILTKVRHTGNHIPLHPSDRHALDLAGSREQRGSAFELYRKPQIGTAGGHHHNMRWVFILQKEKNNFFNYIPISPPYHQNMFRSFSFKM
jgi:tight junction protein 1